MAKTDQSRSLRFVPLDLNSIFLAVFSDAGFATNMHSKSQLCFVVTPADKSNRANITDYTSFKAKQVTRIVVAGKLFALVLAFDFASTVRAASTNVFGRTIPMTLFTDSKSLYDRVEKMSSTTADHVLIELKVLCEAF